jgi:putative glutamine amidotransferase
LHISMKAGCVPRFPTRRSIPDRHFITACLTLDEDSRVYRVLRCNPCRVNALNHQAVDALGTGLRVVGRDTAGIVQAIEALGDNFLIGVQWHPELLPHSRPQQRLFRALIAAARDHLAAEAGRGAASILGGSSSGSRRA